MIAESCGWEFIYIVLCSPGTIIKPFVTLRSYSPVVDGGGGGREGEDTQNTRATVARDDNDESRIGLSLGVVDTLVNYGLVCGSAGEAGSQLTHDDDDAERPKAANGMSICGQVLLRCWSVGWCLCSSFIAATHVRALSRPPRGSLLQ